MTDRILILDFGSQVTQLIARRVRENGVYSEIHPYTMSAEAIRAFAPKGIILSGGPASVHEQAAPLAPKKVFEMGVPVLGIRDHHVRMLITETNVLLVNRNVAPAVACYLVIVVITVASYLAGRCDRKLLRQRLRQSGQNSAKLLKGGVH